MSRRSPGEGTVSLRKDGRWEGKIQVHGVRKTVYGKTEREAKRKLKEVQSQVTKIGAIPTCGKKTVSDLLDFWLANVTLKPRTIDDYERVCRLYVRPYIGHLKLSVLEPTHLQWLYSELQNKGLKRMPYYAHQTLHRALRLAVLWGWLASNPADRVLAPQYRPERKTIWSKEELAVFLEGTAGHWLQPLWITAITTGCRLGELLAIRWQDVDEDTLTVKRNLQHIGGQWLEGTPKTRSGERTITLPREAIAALRVQNVQQKEWRLKAGSEWQDSERVFCGLKGQPLRNSVAEHNIKRECERLALPPLTPHGLRHLHASLLLAGNLPITAVSSRLGHANPGITMSIYAHAIKKQDEEAATIIGAALKDNAL